jgi:hypothetical protein
MEKEEDAAVTQSLVLEKLVLLKKLQLIHASGLTSAFTQELSPNATGNHMDVIPREEDVVNGKEDVKEEFVILKTENASGKETLEKQPSNHLVNGNKKIKTSDKRNVALSRKFVIKENAKELKATANGLVLFSLDNGKRNVSGDKRTRTEDNCIVVNISTFAKD